MFFRNLPTGQRKAQERLLKLHRAGKLERHKHEGVFVYYLERPKLLSHLLGVNWTRIWIQNNLRSWERLHSFQYEQDYGLLRCDALYVCRNTVTGQFWASLIEFDRGTNKFDKIRKYCRFYEKGGYQNLWWARVVKRFPVVFIVTTTPGRYEQIKELIKEENSAGLEFRVKLLDEIKEECFNGHGVVCAADKNTAGKTTADA